MSLTYRKNGANSDALNGLLTKVIFVLISMLLASCDLVEEQSPREALNARPAAGDHAIQARLSHSVPKKFVIRAGDVLSVFVLDNPELSRIVTVGPDGKFRYPLAGEISAGNRSLLQIERILTSRLSATIVDPQVSIGLADLQSYRIYVDGEVTQPGEFNVGSPVTIVQAIALAGGFTAFADKHNVILYNPRRDNGRRIIFSYEDFLLTQGAKDLFLLPGDTVIVR